MLDGDGEPPVSRPAYREFNNEVLAAGNWATDDPLDHDS